MSAKRSSSAAKASKKVAARPTATHPSWIDMIKECIAAEDSRQGVSRPHIKKYVEEQYNLQIGNAQNTQLARAIATGAEKGIFVLPKGPAGKVKLPPKNAKPADTSASKENKPAKVVPKPATKGRPAKAAPTKRVVAKSTPVKKVPAKAKAVAAAKVPAAKKVAEKKSKPAAARPAPAKAPKKVLAGKRAVPAKKTAAPSKRGVAKKTVTGTSAPAKAKAAATKRAPTSKKAPASKKVPSKRSPAKTST